MLQIVFGKVVLVSSLAVDWPFGVGLRLYIEFAQAVDYDVGMDVACSVIAMQDVRTGKIQCIVVKDLSRFGRDYIETGNYLETIFPMLHVRFIAINDDFDNIRQSDVDSLAVPIKNMVNSLYAKDISKKISLSYQMRREKGIPTSWCTPYGYQLNQQGNKFEATEDAKWVKLIYQLSFLPHPSYISRR